MGLLFDPTIDRVKDLGSEEDTIIHVLIRGTTVNSDGDPAPTPSHSHDRSGSSGKSVSIVSDEIVSVIGLEENPLSFPHRAKRLLTGISGDLHGRVINGNILTYAEASDVSESRAGRELKNRDVERVRTCLGVSLENINAFNFKCAKGSVFRTELPRSESKNRRVLNRRGKSPGIFHHTVGVREDMPGIDESRRTETRSLLLEKTDRPVKGIRVRLYLGSLIKADHPFLILGEGEEREENKKHFQHAGNIAGRGRL